MNKDFEDKCSGYHIRAGLDGLDSKDENVLDVKCNDCEGMVGDQPAGDHDVAGNNDKNPEFVKGMTKDIFHQLQEEAPQDAPYWSPEQDNADSDGEPEAKDYHKDTGTLKKGSELLRGRKTNNVGESHNGNIN